MKSIIFLSFLFTLSFTMTTRMKQTLQLDSKFSELQDSALGRMLSNLIELHMEIGGPVEELMQAVDEFITELETKKQREMDQYERLRGEYLDLMQQFEAQISKAKLDISTSESKIEIILQPRVDHLQEALVQVKDNLEENDQQYKEESEQREQKYQMYQKLSKSFKFAIETADQCLEIIENMKNSNNKYYPQFVQINKAKKQILSLKSSLEDIHDQYSPLLAALVNLSQQEFDNPEVLEGIISLLSQLKEQVGDHFTFVTEQENKESDAWSQRSGYLNQERMFFIQRQSDYEEEHKQTNIKIESEKKFKETRQDELDKIVKDMSKEKQDWEKVTSIHDDLMRRIENDHNLTLVAKQNILQHADQINKFADTKRKSVEWKQSEKLWD